jgi:hypothetical protein
MSEKSNKSSKAGAVKASSAGIDSKAPVRAFFDGGPSIEELCTADTTKLQILCEPKFPAPFLAPSLIVIR